MYNSAEAGTTALTSGLVSNIPTNGATLYARLYSKINGAWQYQRLTPTRNPLPPYLAVLLTPTQGTKLTSSSATFTWSAGTGRRSSTSSVWALQDRAQRTYITRLKATTTALTLRPDQQYTQHR